MRQALTFATDREGYADHDRAGHQAAGRHASSTPRLKWHNPDIVQEGNDPDAAAPLIAEYCSESPVNGAGDPQCTNGKVNIELQFSGPVGDPDA